MEELYSDQYHVYRDLWSARVWNHYRWCRILIHDHILSQISKVETISTELAGQGFRSVDIISIMARDICDSVISQYNPEDKPDGQRTRLAPRMTGGKFFARPSGETDTVKTFPSLSLGNC